MNPSPVFLADTNCLIASVLSSHEHHQRTIAEINRRRSRGELLVVSAHSLVEAVSVLTRLPGIRLPPSLANRLIVTNFVTPDSVVALDASEYVQMLADAAAAAISGGRLYDAIIAACARKARASTILTWNRQHFLGLVSPAIDVAVPGDQK